MADGALAGEFVGADVLFEIGEGVEVFVAVFAVVFGCGVEGGGVVGLGWGFWPGNFWVCFWCDFWNFGYVFGWSLILVPAARLHTRTTTTRRSSPRT